MFLSEILKSKQMFANVCKFASKCAQICACLKYNHLNSSNKNNLYNLSATMLLDLKPFLMSFPILKLAESGIHNSDI